MNAYKCPYGEYINKGLKKYYLCKISNSICGYQRYCTTKRDIEFTVNAPNCKIFIEIEKQTEPTTHKA